MDPIADRLIRAYPGDQAARVFRATKADALAELERLREVIARMDDFTQFPEGAAGVILYALLRTRADTSPDVGDFDHARAGVEQLLGVAASAIRDEGPWGMTAPPNASPNAPPNAAPKWRRLIRSNAFGCEFAPGATEAALAAAERTLGIALPAELTDFLRDTDGASAAYDPGLVWSLAEIVSVNRDVDGAPAERLLFFANERTRGRYAYAIVDGAVRDADVFFWDAATNGRRWVAPSLAAYVDQRLDGTLPRADDQP